MIILRRLVDQKFVIELTQLTGSSGSGGTTLQPKVSLYTHAGQDVSSGFSSDANFCP